MNRKITLLVALLMAAAIPSVAQEAYKNPKLSAEERAEDLLSRLTLEEKVKLMEHGSPAIERLGIPQFNWWNEALHGVGRNGTATVLPITMGMAASFNESLVNRAFTAVSDEARAKNNLARKMGRCNIYEGLSFWTPNINIFRDPRWGRGQETYGEDPYLTTRMGLAVVDGLQGPRDAKYRKLYACAKHFAVHSGPEWNRHSFDVQMLPERDLWETYLPAFKALVQEGDVREVMCAYNSIDGEPCCGNTRYLQQILRNEWGFDGIVTSDCWALNDFWQKGHHEVSDGVTSGIAMALIAGTDVECGNTYGSLIRAVEEGKVTEKQVDASLKRLLIGRFELGDFDDDSLVPWRSIGPEVIACKEHRALSLQLARESIVLLQNKDGILPLSKDMKVAVIGPNAADSVMLWGNYNGFPSHTTTILEGIRQKVGNVNYLHACGLVERNVLESRFARLGCGDGRRGLAAEYFNNQTFEGEPVSKRTYRQTMRFDNGGATTFAQGVNIEDFSARYTGVYRADKTEDIQFSVAHTDRALLVVGGDTLVNAWGAGNGDEPRKLTVKYHVDKGESYDVQLLFAQDTGSAVLHFDVGVPLGNTDEEILQATADADVVIFVGGISPKLEGEEMKTDFPGFKGGDRTHIELPQVQRDIMAALKKAGRKVVFVNCSGGAVALVPETRNADAILQAWYGGECGGEALADVLFGDYNPTGKLPVTFYKDDSQIPDFLNYEMKGRTYRFMKERPLFDFGFGMSYTTFEFGEPKYKKGSVSVKVTNTGKVDGEEVVQVYLRKPGDTGGPNKTLRAYKKVSVPAGKTIDVKIDLPRDSFEWWDAATNTMRVQSGEFDVMVGNSSRPEDLKTITVKI